uniref:Uncharacterized protein n=1 Tax=Salix viminalis TaxID=40686 RepID=A0A6N2LRN9_SALVM
MVDNLSILSRIVRRQVSAAKNAIEDLWKLAFSYQVNHLAAVQPLPSTTRGGCQPGYCFKTKNKRDDDSRDKRDNRLGDEDNTE